MTAVRVLATAGHVDHGKTALVAALTGHQTDRLAEERRRGITIELGFAPLDLEGRPISLIDVPGHERFVRHMVAGASGVDGFLLCVAADDGVMPQTREHLDVLTLLGVTQGVVAITKTDRVAPERAIAQVRALLGQDIAVVPVCAPTGEGVSELRTALRRVVDGLARHPDEGPSRLFIDRCFTAPGAGTVVTGTLWGAPLRVGDRVAVQPGGREGRIRGLHVHGEERERVTAGRVAVNVAGIDRDQAPRGAALVQASDAWTLTERVDVEMTVLDSAPGSIATRRRLQAFLGTTERPASCVLLEGDRLRPGDRGLVQLRFERPLLARRGDRVVLRSSDPLTVAGAVILDAHPARHGRGSGAAERLRALRDGAAPDWALQLVRAGTNGVPGEEVGDDAAIVAAGVRLGDRWFARSVVRDARRVAADASSPDRPIRVERIRDLTGLPMGAARELAAEVATSRAAPVRSPEAERIARMIGEAGRRPPSPAVVAETLDMDPSTVRRALRELVADGTIVRAGELWFDTTVLTECMSQAHSALMERPRTLGDLRDLWGVGRRQALALAAHLDGIGMTRCDGDRRVLRRSFSGPKE